VIAGPGSSETPGHQDALRASDDDREHVIGTLKTAFVQGRLTEEELGERAGLVYASRTYAELAEVTAGVTADIPGDLTGRTGVRPRRDPWRATKIAWRVEYAVFLPGIAALLLMPGGPRTTPGEIAVLTAVVYLLFWTLGVAMMVTSRPARPALMAEGERLHTAHAVARDQVIRILTAALAQGRLTEEEHDERAALVPASRCWADLDALIADLPAGLASQPPKARDVRTGLGVSAAAASVLAAIVLWQPDNPLAFLLGLLATAVLVVAPVITVGLWADVRHQKRPGRQSQSRRRERSRRRRPA
jgi:hypothetical protein